MLDSLKNSLKQAESVDILTAFFYFSGFNALAEELKDKKIRILVGNTIDPTAVMELCNAIKDCPDEPLETYGVRGYARLNNSQKKTLIPRALSTCLISRCYRTSSILQIVNQYSKCSFQKLKMELLK